MLGNIVLSVISELEMQCIFILLIFTFRNYLIKAISVIKID